MTDAYSVRLATLDDIPIIVHHRHAMFAEMDAGTEESLDAMCAPSAAWIHERMERGEYVGFLAQDSAGAVIGGAGLWLMEWIPGPIDLTDRRAYILNVYVEIHARRQGVARRLVTAAVDWSREHGYLTAILHASDAGRSLYVAMGFQPSNEMRFEIGTSY